MTYAIIGTGNIGSALARLFARAGIEVTLANTRTPEARAEALRSDIVFLAVPFGAVEEVGRSLPDWTGRIVVDMTNAHYAPGSAEVLRGRLSTHYVAERFPGAAVVKAFNQLPAGTLAAELDPGAGKRVIFIATDTPEAGDRVEALVAELGLAAVRLGRIDEGGRLIEAPNALVLRHLIERPL